MSGIVFMSYARDDRDRVCRLVDYLSAQEIHIWWDDDIEPGQRFRWVIREVLEQASCVIVVWTYNSVRRDFVCSEADRALRRGILVPVLFDADAAIPQPFEQLQHLDLRNGMARVGV